MKSFLAGALTVPFLATAAQAVPIAAVTNTSISHAQFYAVNGQPEPAGLEIRFDPETVAYDAAATVTLGDPRPAPSSTRAQTFGDPLAIPAVPFTATGRDEIGFPERAAATSSHDVEALTVFDPDGNPNRLQIMQHDVNSDVSSAVTVPSKPIAARAVTTVSYEQRVTFRNVTNADILFGLFGMMEVSVTSTFDGVDGFAFAEASAYSFLTNIDDAAIQFAPSSAYIPHRETSPNGASSVEESLGFGISGVSIEASAFASGRDPAVTSRVHAGFEYTYFVTLRPGGSFQLRTGLLQEEFAVFSPEISVVPLPASALLLLGGLGALLVARRSASA